MKLEIVNATSEHVRKLSETIREADKKEAERIGLNPKKGLFYAYRQSIFRKTALLDGEPIAMWGIGGSLFASSGKPWLITGTGVEKISPIKFARLYKKQVEDMRAYFDVLTNQVDAEYEGAVRMLKIAGFTLSEPFKVEPSGALFRTFVMVNE
jgi:hypothetical protein